MTLARRYLRQREFGHVLGLEHDDELSSVMNAVLDPGTHHDLDDVFADQELMRGLEQARTGTGTEKRLDQAVSKGNLP